MAQQPPVGVAIIGSGIFVKSQHLAAVVECELLALKAIFSRTLRAAEEAAALIPAATGGGPGPRPQLYADDAGPGRGFDDVLARADVAAVVVALPIVVQPAFVAAALRAGKHVLAEKPLAPDVAAARALLGGPGAERLSVAENVRFQARPAYAAAAVRRLGRVTHFSVRVMGMTAADGQWCATAWRREPAHQGSFLLDGGVHHAAATRLLLGTAAPANRPRAVAAFTARATAHLPPVDSVAAVVATAGGATGTLQHSAGSRSSAFEWEVACERGAVRSDGDVVTVRDGAAETARRFARETGVPAEVAAWAAGVVSGERDARLAPAEALADLELVEKMLRSGEQGGAPLELELQV